MIYPHPRHMVADTAIEFDTVGPRYRLYRTRPYEAPLDEDLYRIS